MHISWRMEKVPIIEDSKEQSSHFRRLSTEIIRLFSRQHDLFIDVTGWDRRACESSLMLIALQAKERGGTVQTIHITDCNGQEEILPQWKPVHHRVPARLVSTVLGRELNDEELISAITRMGGAYTADHQLKMTR